MVMIPIERAFNLTEAQTEIRRVFRCLQFRYELSLAGERVFAAKCNLYDQSEQLVSTGLGKGNKQAAITGALFEALEHYVTDISFLNADDIFHLPSSYFSSSHNKALANLISSVIHQSHAGFLPCISHSTLNTGSDDLLFPVGIFIPKYIDEICNERTRYPQDTYDYSRLGEYSSNTGVAIGMNKVEALVHGILESSERDALSRFIFNAFIKREKEYLRKLDTDSLPRELRILADNVAEECSAGAVSIYSLPNRFGIPTYCSWINKTIAGIYLSGFGCSLSESHAIERSLFEVAQGYLALTKLHQPSVAEEYQRKKIRNLQKYPSHLRCAEFNIASLEGAYGYKNIKYQGAGSVSQLKLNQYLKCILSRISGIGGTAHSVDFVLPVATNLKVAHSIISDSDRFMTVLGGRVPLPSAICGAT